MKKLLALFVVITTLFTNGCKKADDRDAFIGEYSISVIGYLNLTINGQNYSNLLNETSSIKITEASDSDAVKISGYYDCQATVSGNTITMESMTGTQTTSNGLTVQLVIIPKKGTLNGNTLTFAVDVTGTAYYNGNSYPVSGMIQNEAIKQ